MFDLWALNLEETDLFTVRWRIVAESNVITIRVEDAISGSIMCGWGITSQVVMSVDLPTGLALDATRLSHVSDVQNISTQRSTLTFDSHLHTRPTYRQPLPYSRVWKDETVLLSFLVST